MFRPNEKLYHDFIVIFRASILLFWLILNQIGIFILSWIIGCQDNQQVNYIKPTFSIFGDTFGIFSLKIWELYTQK